MCDQGRIKFGIDGEEKKEREEEKAVFEGLTKKMKGILGDKVEKAGISDRMVESTCSLDWGI